MFWTVALRAIGTVIFLLGSLGGTWYLTQLGDTVQTLADAFPAIIIIFSSMTLAVLCFAVASIGSQLHQVNERTAKHSAAFRYLLRPSATTAPPAPVAVSHPQQKTIHKDLAPVAPNWSTLPDPLFESMEERKQWERLIAHRKAMMGE